MHAPPDVDSSLSMTAPGASHHNVDPDGGERSWSFPTVVAFRLSVVYFGWYCLTVMLGTVLANPFMEIPDLNTKPPLKQLIFWIGSNVLRLDQPIVIQPTGSGDTLFAWVEAFTGLLLAAIVTTIWTIVQRRTAHPEWYRWFRVLVRCTLGATMVGYGVAKVIPTQMPELVLHRLVEPFGDFSPMGVLWTSIGAAPAYEIFVGSAEVVAGLLLFVPRTTLIGALMSFMNSVAVFVLNMTYDVPVKLYSFHLVVMSVLLLAPYLRGLARHFVFSLPVAPTREPALRDSGQSNRRWVAGQALFATYLLLFGLYSSNEAWSTYGGGAPRPALFGIWEIQESSVDGVVRLPLLSDSTQWRRLIFQYEGRTAIQRMDDKFEYFRTSVNSLGTKLTLQAGNKKDSGEFTIARRGAELLDLSGPYNGKLVRLTARLRDHEAFVLRSRGFHWVQEFPFNR